MKKPDVNFKRPDHPDFMDSFELKKVQFSGIRMNRISGYREIWINGEVKGEMHEHVVATSPHLWLKLYSETFGFGDNVEVLER